jgi:hypothetical protein
MMTQELLDAKSWAERTFGNVHLHDVRRSRRTVQAESLVGGEPGEVLARSHAELEREQSVVSVAR